MPSDAELMESGLVAVANSGTEIRHALFDKFFAAFPGRRETFYTPEAASRRMTDETLQMMFGLASDEPWVWPLVTELVFTHRSYGFLPIEEYDAFIELTVDELALAAGCGWTPSGEAAWRRQARRLKLIIRTAREEWREAMPGPPPGETDARLPEPAA